MPRASIIYEDENNRRFRITAKLSHIDPGNTYGPPENCYPPEGGDLEEIESVEYQNDGRYFSIIENKVIIGLFEHNFLHRLNNDTALYEKIEQLLLEAVDNNYDYDETDVM